MGSSLRDIYEQREMLRRGDEIAQAAEQAAAREAERLRLRDKFAASALSGMLARESIDDDPLEFHFLCEHAYKWADAMLDARDRPTDSE